MTRNPALDQLGDRLETAAATTIASGGPPTDTRRLARLALIPALALFVFAALAITYVVPGGEVTSAEASVLAAAEATGDRSTGRFEVRVEVAGGAEDALGPLAVSVQGAYDLEQDRYRVSLDTSSLAAALGGSAGEWGADAAGVDEIEVVVVGSDVYLNLGPIADLLGTDVRWVSMTLPDLEDGAGGGVTAPDPQAPLDLLAGLGEDVTEVGREDVRGTETTHYRGVVRVEDAFEAIPEEERGQLEEALATLVPDLVLPDVPVDVWVDDEGLLRKVSLTVDASGFGLPDITPVTGSATVTVEYFDIGAPVDIEVPSEDETVALDDLFGDLLGGFELPDLGGFGSEELGDLFGELGDTIPETLDDLGGALDDLFGDDGGEDDGAEDDGDGGSDAPDAGVDEDPPPTAAIGGDKTPTTV